MALVTVMKGQTSIFRFNVERQHLIKMKLSGRCYITCVPITESYGRMVEMKKILGLTTFMFAFQMIFAGRAHAYLDPGTGSMLLQGLIGGVAAAMGVAGLYWSKIKAFFSKDSVNKTESDKED